MDRAELLELYYITPIANLASILEHGLLSNRRAQKYNPASVAMAEVQERREEKRVPGGLLLHDYVNLYICARNPMLYKRLGYRHDICVLTVAPDVIDLEGVVVTDQNAASKYVRYGSGPDGLAIVNRDRTFAEYWTDDDPVERWRRKAAKCAEVLVPHRVDPKFVTGACVCGKVPRDKIAVLQLEITVVENQNLFFDHR